MWGHKLRITRSGVGIGVQALLQRWGVHGSGCGDVIKREDLR